MPKVNYSDLIGLRFERLVVKEYIGSKTYLCLCDCGKVVKSNRKTLKRKDGKYGKSCGCLKTEKLTKFTPQETYINRLKNGADKRKLPFTITTDYIFDLLKQQNYRCALTNFEIKFSSLSVNDRQYNKNDTTASLDRIDSSKGYIEGNVQWVHKTVNRLKSDLSMDKLIILARNISRKFKNSKIGKPFGFTYALDCYGVASNLLDSEEYLRLFLEDLVIHLGVNKQADAVIFKTPNDNKYQHGEGYTGYIPLIQSGISFHSMPSQKFISIDIYTCCEMDTNKVKQFVLDRFNFIECDEEFIERGLGYYVK